MSPHSGFSHMFTSAAGSAGWPGILGGSATVVAPLIWSENWVTPSAWKKAAACWMVEISGGVARKEHS